MIAAIVRFKGVSIDGEAVDGEDGTEAAFIDLQLMIKGCHLDKMKAKSEDDMHRFGWDLRKALEKIGRELLP